jgi:two-component system sensor histidine kinase BarA
MSRVLVIDDEPSIASLVEFCLDPLGVDVVQARGLQSALEVARMNAVGLVLLDLALDGEDGLAILPHLRAEPSLSGRPIVAFTAHDSRRREALDSGVDSFLARPFASADLRSTVELLLVP